MRFTEAQQGRSVLNVDRLIVMRLQELKQWHNPPKGRLFGAIQELASDIRRIMIHEKNQGHLDIGANRKAGEAGCGRKSFMYSADQTKHLLRDSGAGAHNKWEIGFLKIEGHQELCIFL